MITVGILLYVLYAQTNIKFNEVNYDINSYRTETNSKINSLIESIQKTQETLSSINESFKDEIKLLKSSTSSDFSGIIEDAIKGVITVRTDISQGTGFIITEDGYAITNAHVLSEARQLYVIDYNQKTIPAELIGYDLNLDIALLKLPDNNYYELDLETKTPQVGSKVIAIGNPLGLQFSVSEGIVSAVNRPGPNNIEAYIQTDAALNPGNSGGPLINKEGYVVGINNFKLGSGESLGFALESGYIEDSVNDIARNIINQTLI
jgi:S1-C subfamily serine protease